MTTFSISLTSVDQVKIFSDTAAKYPFEIDVCSGRYRLNAKSIMALFSLDLGKPVVVEIADDSQDFALFRDEIAHLIVES